jgi:hypothetical protein
MLGKFTWNKSRVSGIENREYGHRDPSRWPRGTLYSQNLAVTSPTSGGRSVRIFRSLTKATELQLVNWCMDFELACTTALPHPIPPHTDADCSFPIVHRSRVTLTACLAVQLRLTVTHNLQLGDTDSGLYMRYYIPIDVKTDICTSMYDLDCRSGIRFAWATRSVSAPVVRPALDNMRWFSLFLVSQHLNSGTNLRELCLFLKKNYSTCTATRFRVPQIEDHRRRVHGVWYGSFRGNSCRLMTDAVGRFVSSL